MSINGGCAAILFHGEGAMNSGQENVGNFACGSKSGGQNSVVCVLRLLVPWQKKGLRVVQNSTSQNFSLWFPLCVTGQQLFSEAINFSGVRGVDAPPPQDQSLPIQERVSVTRAAGGAGLDGISARGEISRLSAAQL